MTSLEKKFNKKIKLFDVGSEPDSKNEEKGKISNSPHENKKMSDKIKMNTEAVQAIIT